MNKKRRRERVRLFQDLTRKFLVHFSLSLFPPWNMKRPLSDDVDVDILPAKRPRRVAVADPTSLSPLVAFATFSGSFDVFSTIIWDELSAGDRRSLALVCTPLHQAYGDASADTTWFELASSCAKTEGQLLDLAPVHPKPVEGLLACFKLAEPPVPLMMLLGRQLPRIVRDNRLVHHAYPHHVDSAIQTRWYAHADMVFSNTIVLPVWGAPPAFQVPDPQRYYLAMQRLSKEEAESYVREPDAELALLTSTCVHPISRLTPAGRWHVERLSRMQCLLFLTRASESVNRDVITVAKMIVSKHDFITMEDVVKLCGYPDYANDARLLMEWNKINRTAFGRRAACDAFLASKRGFSRSRVVAAGAVVPASAADIVFTYHSK